MTVKNIDGTDFLPPKAERAGDNVIPLLSPKGCRDGRRSLRWSQQHLASEAGLSIATVVNFELGKHRLRPRNIAAIGAVFEDAGVSIVGDKVILRPLRAAK